MEEPEARPRRRLDPKTASMAGFLDPHANSSSTHGHRRGNAGAGGGGWKARLKERCLNRVRQERDRLVQEMRGLSSPPPPGAAAAAASAAGAARPFLPSPPPVIAGVGAAVGTPHERGQQQSRRASTPSSLSGAALSILQHEIGESRREQQQQGEGMAVVAEEEGDEEALLSVEEQLELMRCIEEVLAQEMAWAEESAAGEYSQLEHAEVEGSVAQLYDYEEVPPDDAAVLCPSCKANYLVPLHAHAHSRPSSSSSSSSSSASSHRHHDDQGGGGGTPVVCACGVRLELQGGTGLAQLQERLAAAYGHHRASACPVREPTFYQREHGRDLWVECGACGLNAQVA